MTNSVSTTKNIWIEDDNKKGESFPFWTRSKGFSAVFFFVLTIIIALIGYLGANGKFSDIKISGEGGFVVAKLILLIFSALGFLMTANAIFVANNDTSVEKEAYAKTNTCLFFFNIVTFAFWPLFYFSVATPLVSSIFIFVSICISIYLIYRLFSLSLYAGILYSLWTFWQIFVFVLNLATFLTAA